MGDSDDRGVPEELRRHHEYWLGVSSRGLGRPALTPDAPRVASSPHDSALTRTLTPQLRRQIERIAGPNDLPFFAVITAALLVCLRRHEPDPSAATRCLVGTPALAKHPVCNAVTLAVDVAPGDDFRTLLTAVRDAALAAYRHQAYPIASLIAAAGDTPNRCPLFDVLVRMEGLHGAPPQLTHDLSVDVVRASGELRFRFSARRFASATLERLADQLTNTLEQATSALRTPIAALDGLSEVERTRLLSLGRGPSVALDELDLAHTRIEAWARRTPSATAAIDARETVSYAELDRRAEAIAQYLRRCGSGPESRIAVAMERSIEHLVALIGILKAGAVYVFIEPTFPGQRLRMMIEDAQPERVLTQPRWRAAVADAGAFELVTLEPGGAIEPPTASLGAAHDHATASLRDAHLAYVMFTSGSTGRPKGAMVSHRALRDRMAATRIAYPIEPSDRVLQNTALSFDISLQEIFATLTTGAALVIPSPDRDIDALVALIARHQVTVIHAVPTVLRLLADHPEFHGCVSVRLLYSIGEPLVPSLARTLLETPGRRLLNAYGPTEATLYATFEDVRDVAVDAASVSIGRPLINTAVYVLDARLRWAPQGAAGDLWIGGPGVGRGYLGRARLSAASFLPDPHGEPGALMYRTGDRARFTTDGRLEYLGRTDDQLKLRGQRIELGEIVAALSAQAGVAQCEVVAGPSASDGKILVAYLVTDAPTDADTLRAALAKLLPDFMIPTSFLFLDALPTLPSGKIDRGALPPPTLASTPPPYVAPTRHVERVLSQIWREVLGVDAVGIHDNFFALGGESVQTLIVASRSRRAGVHVTPQQIYVHQTIARIAALGDLHPPPLTTAARLGPVPLTPSQQRTRLRTAEPYARLYRARAPLDHPALRAAFDVVCARHDVLSYQFDTDGQRASDRPRVQLDTTPNSDAELDFADALRLDEGPLLHARLFPRTDRDQIAIAVHPLVFDHFSWTVLVDDWASAYRAITTQQALPEASPSTYKLWSEQLAAHAATDAGAAERALHAALARRLTDAGDPPLGPRETSHFELSADDTRRLLEQTESRFVPLLVCALGSSVEGPRGVVDIESHGREPLFEGVDVDRIVGSFTTIAPVVVDQRLAPRARIDDVTAQLERGGQGYGLVAGPTPPRALVSFSDLRRVEHPSPWLELLHERPRLSPRHLPFTAAITDGRLRLEVEHSADVRDAAAAVGRACLGHVAAWVHTERPRYALAGLGDDDLTKVLARARLKRSRP